VKSPILMAPPPLSKQAYEILSDILLQTSEADPKPGVDSVYYRARHPEKRDILDALLKEGLLIGRNDEAYLLSLKALFILRNPKAIEILSVCSEIFIALQILYKEDPKKPILVSELASRLGRPIHEIIKALVYLREAPIFGGYSTDLSDQKATIKAAERILDHSDFNSVLLQQWEWHLSHHPKFNPLIFGESQDDEASIVSSPEDTQAEPQEISIFSVGLSDAPAPIEHDALDYRAYSAAIVDFLTNKNTKAPFSLAITGPWGSGKTTVLDWIRQALDQYPGHYQTVWFTPWKHNQQEEVWASFARVIIEKLITSPWDKLKLRWARFRNSSPPGGTVTITTAVGTLLLFSAIFISTNAPFIDYFLVVTALVSFVSPYVKPLWKALKSPLLKLLTSTKGPDYDRALGFQKEFEEDLSRLIKMCTPSGKPLFIFVDDLDRAPPPISVKLLEAMNILIGQKCCIFIIGLDLAIVGASIEAKYLSVIERLNLSVHRFTGRDFIEKLVQLEFALPSLTDDQLDTFLDSHLKPIKEATALHTQKTSQPTLSIDPLITNTNQPIAQRSNSAAVPFDEESDQFIESIRRFSKCLPRNPRKIKRFINSYRLLAYIAARRNLFLIRNINLDGLGAVTVLAMEYPELYRLLSQDDYKTDISDIHKWIITPGYELTKNYGLTGGKERYRPLRDTFPILLGSAFNINDYLSLSAVIDPDMATVMDKPHG